MSTSFKCPSCGAPLEYDSSAAPSATVRCPYCSNSVVVPEELRAPPAANPPPADLQSPAAPPPSAPASTPEGLRAQIRDNRRAAREQRRQLRRKLRDVRRQK